MHLLSWLIYTASLFSNEDTSCRYKLYETALKDTLSLTNYYVCYQLKYKEGDTVKAASPNNSLWYFFKKNNYSWEQYQCYMLNLLKNDSPLDLVSFNDIPAHYDCTLTKETKRVLKRDKVAVVNYFNKAAYDSKHTAQDIFAFADLVYVFWGWGIGLCPGEEGDIIIRYNCMEQSK